MECTKLAQREIDRWLKLIDRTYDTSPLYEHIDIHEWTMVNLALDSAIDEDIEEMNDILSSNPPALERIRRVPELNALIKRLFEHGVACGDAASCCNLGNYYHDTSDGGSPKDYMTAIELYELGKARGDVQSAVNLGYIFYYGRGVAHDYLRAHECFAFGALMGDNPEGYWKLGDLYASGKGVHQSDMTAWAMYHKAYTSSDGSPILARAAHHLADYLLSGIEGHLEPDPESALKLYVEAEAGYYTLIDGGLTYYSRQLEQVIEGQADARKALQEHHRRIRGGEME